MISLERSMMVSLPILTRKSNFHTENPPGKPGGFLFGGSHDCKRINREAARIS